MSLLRELFDWRNPKCCCPQKIISQTALVFTLTLLSMIVLIDLLASAIVQTQLQGFLAIDDTRAVWIGKAFFFMSAIAPLYVVHLANLYGCKRLIFIGSVVFFFGSTMTAAAANCYELIFYRALAGTGGGIILFISLSLLTRTLPKENKKTAIVVYTNTFFGLGIVSGLWIGGYFGQAYHWQVIYWMNIPLALVMLPLMLLFIPETETCETPPFDFLGFLGMTGFCFCMLLIVTQAKAPWNTMGWNSVFIRSSSAGAAVFLLLFFYAGAKGEAPIVPFRLFAHPRFTIGCLGMAVVGQMVFGATLALMTLLERVYLYQRSTVGLFVSLVGAVYFLVGLILSLLIRRVQPRLFILIGMTLIIVSCFMNQTMTIQSDMFEIGLSMTIRSIGIALVLGPLVVVALGQLGSDEFPKGNAFMSFIRFMAATFGSSWISLIIAIRTPYHALRFGEQVDQHSARFQQYLREYQLHNTADAGASLAEGAEKAKFLMIDYILKQAEIASFNDSLYIMGWTTALVAGLMAVFMAFRIWRMARNPFQEEPEWGF